VLEGELRGDLPDAPLVGPADVRALARERHGPIQGSRVHDGVAQRLGDTAGHGALASTGGSIDGHDRAHAAALHARTSTRAPKARNVPTHRGKNCRRQSTSSTVVGPSARKASTVAAKASRGSPPVVMDVARRGPRAGSRRVRPVVTPSAPRGSTSRPKVRSTPTTRATSRSPRPDTVLPGRRSPSSRGSVAAAPRRARGTKSSPSRAPTSPATTPPR